MKPRRRGSFLSKREKGAKGFTYPDVVRHMTVFLPSRMLLTRFTLFLAHIESFVKLSMNLF